MKKVFLALIVVLLTGVSAFAQEGEKSIGLKLNYGGEIESFGLGANFTYNVTNAIRINPSINYYFKHNHVSLFNVDADFHYLFPFAEGFAAYPLIGITFQNWKAHSYTIYGNEWGFINTNSKNFTRLGINAGGGLQYDINAEWRAFTELKYSIVNDFDQLVFSLGVAWRFN